MIRLGLVAAGAFYAGVAWALRCVDEAMAVGK
jgi:hypothetical protein